MTQEISGAFVDIQQFDLDLQAIFRAAAHRERSGKLGADCEDVEDAAGKLGISFGFDGEETAGRQFGSHGEAFGSMWGGRAGCSRS
ncbi:MAG TPA: hypothetical protein VFB36_05465 [Nevskiaceae bacterium]|nr:hypothetical protein [Nevskiaceae bacterium]